MTLIWFIIWFIADHVGDSATLSGDPVNAWTLTLILAIALDLSRQHAPAARTIRTKRDNCHDDAPPSPTRAAPD
jgi:hypothetical protein